MSKLQLFKFFEELSAELGISPERLEIAIAKVMSQNDIAGLGLDPARNLYIKLEDRAGHSGLSKTDFRNAKARLNREV